MRPPTGSADLFRCHVADRAEHRTRIGRGDLASGWRTGPVTSPPGAARGRLGQPKVENLHLAVGEQKNIGGLQIAVDDASGMRGGRPRATSTAVSTALRTGSAPAVEPLRSVSPSSSSMTT